MTRAGYPDAPVPGAARFDAGGRPNPVVVPMVREGLGVVLELRPARVAPALAAWCNVVAHAAAQLGWVALPRSSRAPHILGLRPGPKLRCPADGQDLGAAGVVARLVSGEGLDYRVKVSARCGAMRVAPHVYNTEEDARRFLSALGRATALELEQLSRQGFHTTAARAKL
mmetsp:Transcript_27672/g.87746  ORF Transcript_27672/g.87746 Transcript_27672/m.87746 type:complete len:170 (+) Transcript_27672:926-1435(+)